MKQSITPSELADRIAGIPGSQIMKVYSGRHGCACGCRGKYTYASAPRDLASKHRGYVVGDDEVNDSTVRTMRARMVKLLREPGARVICEGDDDDGCYAFDTPTRSYSLFTVAAA